MSDLISQRVFQIACAYEDANDCDLLRYDPAFKAACGRLPISGTPLASQPTMSRLEKRHSSPGLISYCRGPCGRVYRVLQEASQRGRSGYR